MVYRPRKEMWLPQIKWFVEKIEDDEEGCWEGNEKNELNIKRFYFKKSIEFRRGQKQRKKAKADFLRKKMG